MRLAARTDSNQAEIVAALRKIGCLVEPLHRMGKGIPDLLVQGPDGILKLVEIKNGSKPPSKRKLTSHQIDFQAQGWRVIVVKDWAEALNAFAWRGQ